MPLHLPAGALQLVLNPREGGSALCPKSMWALLEESPENPAVSSAAPTPTGFYVQKLWGFIFLVLEPWAVWPGLGLGSLAPDFIHYM